MTAKETKTWIIKYTALSSSRFFTIFSEGHFKMKFLKEMSITSLEIGGNILVKWNAYSFMSLLDIAIFNFVSQWHGIFLECRSLNFQIQKREWSLLHVVFDDRDYLINVLSTIILESKRIQRLILDVEISCKTLTSIRVFQMSKQWGKSRKFGQQEV